MRSIVLATPSRTLFAVPYWIAEQQGFLREEGIAARLEIIGDAEEIKARLRSGEIEAAIDPADGVMLDALAGGPLRIIAGNACKPPLYIVTRAGIRTLAGLRGATFGVLSLKEGSSKLIPRIAAKAGLAPGDIRVVEVGGAPQRKGLLQQGSIDAGLQPMPLNFEAVADGLNDLGWTGELAPHWQFTTVNASRAWVDSEPKLAEGLLRALIRAMTFMRTNVAGAADIAAAELRTRPEFARRALEETARLGIIDPRLDWSEPGCRQIFQNLQADGRIPQSTPFRLGDYVIEGPLRRAQAG